MGIHFTDGSPALTKGFDLRIENLTTGDVETDFLGYLTDTTVPGFDAGDQIRFSVCAFDDANQPGPWSAPVDVQIGRTVVIPVNVISPPSPIAGIHAVIESPVNLEIPLTVGNLQKTGAALDYATVQLGSVPAGIAVGFDATTWDISSGSALVGVMITATANAAPGEYLIPLRITNAGNPDNSVSATLDVTVSYPPVELAGVSPQSWNSVDATQITASGLHFYAGTRLFINDTELAVSASTVDRLVATVPAGVGAGTHAIRVMGPGGDVAQAGVTVVSPPTSWSASRLWAKCTAARKAGSSTRSRHRTASRAARASA